MENPNAETKVQLRWSVSLHSSYQVPDGVSGAGNLLDMRQDDNTALCPSTETDTTVNDSIQAWATRNAATWARQRLTRIQEGKDE